MFQPLRCLCLLALSALLVSCGGLPVVEELPGPRPLWNAHSRLHGNLLLVQREQGIVDIVDIQSKQKKHTFFPTKKGRPSHIASYDFSPDGSHVLLVGYRCDLHLFETSTGMPLPSPEVFDDRTDCTIHSPGPVAGFSPNGKQIYIAFFKQPALGQPYQAKIQLFDLHEKNPQKSLSVEKFVSFVSFDPQGENMLFSTEANEAFIWHVTKPNPGSPEKITLPHPFDRIHFLSFSPSGSRILFLDAKSSKHCVWDSRKNQLAFCLQEDDSHLGADQGMFSPDGSSILTWSTNPWSTNNPPPTLWNALNGEKQRTFEAHENRRCTSSFSQNGQHVVIQCSDDEASFVWSMDPKQSPLVFSHVDRTIRWMDGLPDGKSLAIATSQHTIEIIDALNGATLKTIPTLGHNPKRLLVLPNGTLASSSLLQVRGYDGKTGQETFHIPNQAQRWPHTAPTLAILRDQNALGIVDGLDINEPSVFSTVDAQTGTLKQKLDPKAMLGKTMEPISFGSFSPDGKRLALVVKKKQIHILPINQSEKNKMVLSMPIDPTAPQKEDDFFIDLVFSRDGKKLAAQTYRTGSVMLWDLEKQSLLKKFDAVFLGGLVGEWSTHSAFTEDGKYLVVQSPMHNLWILDVDKMEGAYFQYPLSGWHQFALVPGQPDWLWTSRGAGIYLWSLSSGQLIRNLIGNEYTSPARWKQMDPPEKPEKTTAKKASSQKGQKRTAPNARKKQRTGNRKTR